MWLSRTNFVNNTYAISEFGHTLPVISKCQRKAWDSGIRRSNTGCKRNGHDKGMPQTVADFSKTQKGGEILETETQHTWKDRSEDHSVADKG